jgi:acetyl esterase/lipase
VVLAAVRASLWFSPRPAALMIRAVFRRTGAAIDRGLAGHAPQGIERLADEPYGDGPDAVLDVYHRTGAPAPAPTIVWVHGGAFVGGSKEELRHWFELLADEGYTVVAPRYSLAPESTYPTQVRQVMAVIGHVCTHAGRLHVDPGRLVLAGDSAGAQLAAQVATLVTSPVYAEQVGIDAGVRPDQLRGVVLCCGAYDPSLFESPSVFVRAVLWAYSGTRDLARDPAFGLMAVPAHVTADFPPVFVTAGNADPLLPQTIALVERLHALGVETDLLMFPPDTSPPLGHEYQFLLDTPAGREALSRIRAFLARRA